MGVAEIVAIAAVVIIGATALLGRTVRRDQRAGLVLVPAADRSGTPAPAPDSGEEPR